MNYLIIAGKIIACSGILYGYYLLFLQNRRFHRYNRFFLVTVLILSFCLPFLKLPVPETALRDPVMNQGLQLVTWGNYHEAFSDTANGNGLPAFVVLWMIYVFGAAMFTWLLLRAFVYLRSLRKKYPAIKLNDINFHNTSEAGTPFSFFKSVFWNSAINPHSNTGQKILKHELFHVRQYHSLDVLLCELVCVVCWFNPFFHIIRKEIQAIHEFLADEHAAGNNEKHAYAELLVLQSIQLRNSQLVQPFFYNHLKRRITMITKFNASRSGYWSRVMILPVAFILFCAFSLYAQRPGSAKHSVLSIPAIEQPFVLMIDAGHGGKDAGAKSADGKYAEKDIALAIAKKLQEEAAAAGITVLMSRTSDVSLTVQERSDLNTLQKPDLFVSIHLGAGPELNNSIGGAEAYIGSKKQQARIPSIELGNNILNALQPVIQVTMPVKERHNAGIWVLDQSPCPGVLIHCGFMTNENDVAFITKEDNQEQIAKNILMGILQFQNNKLKGNSSQQQPDGNLKVAEQSFNNNTGAPASEELHKKNKVPLVGFSQ